MKYLVAANLELGDIKFSVPVRWALNVAELGLIRCIIVVNVKGKFN